MKHTLTSRGFSVSVLRPSNQIREEKQSITIQEETSADRLCLQHLWFNCFHVRHHVGLLNEEEIWETELLEHVNILNSSTNPLQVWSLCKLLTKNQSCSDLKVFSQQTSALRILLPTKHQLSTFVLNVRISSSSLTWIMMLYYNEAESPGKDLVNVWTCFYGGLSFSS